MDKRTLLFIIAVSFTLFFVNLYFQNENIKNQQEWEIKQKQQQAVKEKKLEEEIKYRTASLSELPLVDLYSTEEDSRFLSTAVKMGSTVLTLSWSEEAPKDVYVRDTKTAKNEKYHLASNQAGIGSPLLYQSQKEMLSIPSLPSQGHFDLQLVSFVTSDSSFPATVTLGDFNDGSFSIPATYLKDKKISLNPGTYGAIILFKYRQNYVPVALYETARHQIVPLQNISDLTPFFKTEKSSPALNEGTKEQKFYVLENDYQQLVFSNYGGALAEINLPFQTEKNEKSVVREIEFDRDMVKHHPYNALFPAHSYYTPNQDGSKEFEWHEKGQLGGYYPLLRRDLIETGKRQSVNVSPSFYALNVVSEYPELANLVYEVTSFTKNSITFEAVQNYRRITKTFKLDQEGQEAPYSINLEVRIEGDSKGLWLTTGVPEVEWISGAPAPTLKYRITRNQKSDVQTIDLPKNVTTVTSLYPDWVCNSNGFLGMILDPLVEIDPGYRAQNISGLTDPSRLVEVQQEFDRYKAGDLPGYMMALPLKSTGGTMKFRLFAGPFDTDILKQVDRFYSDSTTGYNPDYISCQTMHGWFTFISEPFAKFLWILMQFFHGITNSWALSIILLTVCLRIILYPLNNWSTKSMAAMQQIAPEVTAIQEKHKKDPKKAQMEIVNLYREKGINPMSGCLPLLIQMPFLIGMFDLLKSSFALRGASFIPGWIDDLTAPDVLFSWKYPIFFIGNEFHLLPILLGVVMLVQQRYFSNAPTDPKMMTDQQKQQRAMGTMMAVVFAIMFYNFPSGLNIYWLSSMLLGMAQQVYTTRKMQKNHTLIVPTQTAKKIK